MLICLACEYSRSPKKVSVLLRSVSIWNGTAVPFRSVSSVLFRSVLQKNRDMHFRDRASGCIFYGVKSALKAKGICNLQRQYARETLRCGVRKREGPPSSRRRAPRRCAALQA